MLYETNKHESTVFLSWSLSRRQQLNPIASVFFCTFFSSCQTFLKKSHIAISILKISDPHPSTPALGPQDDSRSSRWLVRSTQIYLGNHVNKANKRKINKRQTVVFLFDCDTSIWVSETEREKRQKKKKKYQCVTHRHTFFFSFFPFL